MRTQGTHPPSAQQSERYRRAAQWLPPQTVEAHLGAIYLGESRTALVDETSEWSYEQLASAVKRIRTALLQAEVVAADFVLIVAPLRNAAVAAYLATLYCGAVAVWLDRRSGPADVVNAINAAGPVVALAFEEDACRLDLGRHCPVMRLDHVVPATGSGILTDGDIRVDPDSPAAVIFTSGTTSAPKGVVHTINSLRCGTANMIEALAITGDDAFFLSSPLASITGILQIHSALTMHAKVIMADRFSPDSALRRVREHGATVIGGAPVVAEALFAEADRDNLSFSLRCLAVGGAMIPQTVLDSATRFGVRAVRVYGSSEAPFSTATALFQTDSANDEGAPLTGVEIACRDPGGTDELIIRGPHQFHGYLDPTQNTDAFANDWFRTGDQADIAMCRVRVKGRLKEIVIRKGMKISLAEIDSATSGLGDCVAFGISDDETGERVALAIRAETAASDLSYADVVEHLVSGGMTKWKLPEQVVVWDGAYPRTPTGKVIRRHLADERRHLKTMYAPRLALGSTARPTKY